MLLETWTIYVATVLVLMSTPGPSQLLMLSNSAVHGFRRSLATASGDLTANFFQMLAAGLGLAAILAASGQVLMVIKWLGVLYLCWLGLRMLTKAGTTDTEIEDGGRKSLKALWLQGFVTSATNPKAVLFFAALFPQFIRGDAPFWPQFIILSMTYIVMDGLFLSAYGAGSGWLAAKLRGPARAWADRIGGSLMIGAAVLLSVKSLRMTRQCG